jgi:glyoxalase-like protein
MPIDHVLIAVRDLGEAARMMNEQYGLASIEGGRHPGWGTANRIVPLGNAYLELIAVVDPDEARNSVLGQWVARAEPEQPIGWAVRTDDVETAARRLGLDVRAGSRTTPSKTVLRWRSAGVEQAIAKALLPFFIEWSADTPHPGSLGVRHPAGAVQLSRLELRGDPIDLADWLGGERLPIALTPGNAGVSRIVLSAEGRQILMPAS